MLPCWIPSAVWEEGWWQCEVKVSVPKVHSDGFRGLFRALLSLDLNRALRLDSCTFWLRLFIFLLLPDVSLRNSPARPPRLFSTSHFLPLKIFSFMEGKSFWEEKESSEKINSQAKMVFKGAITLQGE